MSRLFKWLLRLVVGLLIAACLGYVAGRLFLFDIAQVEGTGMLPTLGKGAYIMAWKRSEPQRGDIILFQRDGAFRARRVVALPGDEIQFDDLAITVNGQRATYEERYSIEVGGRKARVVRETLNGASYNLVDIKGRRMKKQQGTKVEGGYYVLSDHREMGVTGDSRTLGVIKPEETRGVVRWILDPGDRPQAQVDQPLADKRKAPAGDKKKAAAGDKRRAAAGDKKKAPPGKDGASNKKGPVVGDKKSSE